MPKIEFRENKVMKLTNVLSRKVPDNELLNQDKQAQLLLNWIRAKGYEPIGPLIMYSSGIKGVDGENRPIIDARLMMQIKSSNVRLELPYKFEADLRVSDCLMARFNGEADKLQFAMNKLTLYAYENDLELTGDTYIIFMDQRESFLFADVFMPVKV